MDDESTEVKMAKAETKIEQLETEVNKLWQKWDTMQKLVIGTFVSTTLTLITVLVKGLAS